MPTRMGDYEAVYFLARVLFHPSDGSHRVRAEMFPVRLHTPVADPESLWRRFEGRLASQWDADRGGPLEAWGRGEKTTQVFCV